MDTINPVKSATQIMFIKVYLSGHCYVTGGIVLTVGVG